MRRPEPVFEALYSEEEVRVFASSIAGWGLEVMTARLWERAAGWNVGTGRG